MGRWHDDDEGKHVIDECVECLEGRGGGRKEEGGGGGGGEGRKGVREKGRMERERREGEWEEVMGGREEKE